MKLALVTRRYPPLIGGAEKVLSYLASALADEGAEVTVLTSRAPGLALPSREEVPIDGRSTANRSPSARGRLTIERLATSRLRFWGTWLYMRNLRRWFDRNPVDLAYVSMLKHDAYVTVAAGRRLGFPVVLRPEGAGATGDVAWQSWGNFGRKIGRRCRQADAFVAISRAIEAELKDAWRAGTMRAEGRVELGRRGCRSPADRVDPQWRSGPAGALEPPARLAESPRAAFVGRLAPEKGLDTLVDAWPAVRAAFPGARLILIGEGPERPALEARARALGMSAGPGQAVELPGASADPTAALREVDLFVLPSREEGMSIALLEAMALGVPLVASSIAGNRRIVSDFKHGRLAPPDDPEALARAITDQWAGFDRAFHMGRAARSRVEQEFSIRIVARAHLRLFSELVGGRRGRPAGGS